MLLKNELLQRIVSGEVTLVFRRWKRPTVRSGGTLVTRAGLLGIDSVDVCDPEKISAKDVKAAGFSKMSELIALLSDRDGEVYRISVKYIGEDPRIALRNRSKISASEFSDVRRKLERMDRSKVFGKWTRRYLELIRDDPELLAATLAEKAGLDKPRFKANVRKLKAMGLTESMATGYRLSPRGKTVLKMLASDDTK